MWKHDKSQHPPLRAKYSSTSCAEWHIAWTMFWQQVWQVSALTKQQHWCANCCKIFFHYHLRQDLPNKLPKQVIRSCNPLHDNSYPNAFFRSSSYFFTRLGLAKLSYMKYKNLAIVFPVMNALHDIKLFPITILSILYFVGADGNQQRVWLELTPPNKRILV